ncbi:protein-nucleus import-related protein [Dioszegia hungarica]|uniref:Protein-nucleus import-related protein n=1 Tax=Dioszegia hungarica TaxID=4972 RepID=A0AA38HC05_9TREE|nr:protein-nucleus import-related protein [Dioszegia hungarica]KAI9637475.1 protein-nucleus import-related protein [Dioszegia hungarica]
MSRQEQAALVAWINSFRPSRRITSFDHLADGRAFMELLSSVDPTHFKNPPARGPGAGPSSPDNWVLKTNALKRIHRLLLSFPLPPPHHPLSASTLLEPPFSAIVKSPSSPEGTAGLLQLARMVLCVAVWAPGNERVIAKIQGLGEGHMAELMKAIEEVMGSMPPEESGEGEEGEPEGEAGGIMGRLSRKDSPVKKGTMRPASPPGALRAERDRLSHENEELRLKCETMADQVDEMTATLEEAKSERDDALARLASSRETGAASLRTSQGAGSDAASLRAELKAEETVAKLQDDLSGKTSELEDLRTAMEHLEEEAAEAAKMKDQLDEFRGMQAKLQKSENVIEKYKKKLDDAASVRRELKNLEEENAQLLSINNGLESELRRAGQSKIGTEGSRAQIAALEKQTAEQTVELAGLTAQLEAVRIQLAETELAHELDKEDLELYRQKAREMELGSSGGVHSEGKTLAGDQAEGVKGSLDAELDALTSPAETRTDLKLKIRRLERELASHTSDPNGGSSSQTSVLESLLADAQKSRDRYQADYLSASRDNLQLEARLDAITKGREGSAAMAAALQMQLEEVERATKGLEEEIELVRREAEGVQRELRDAREDCESTSVLTLVDIDQRDVLKALRQTAREDVRAMEERLGDMRDQIDGLKEKDRFRLEEIKVLLNQKVDLQATDVDQREKAVLREMEFGDLKAQLAKGGVSAQTSERLLDLVELNQSLRREVERLHADRSMGHDLSAPPESEPDYSVFEEAQKSYESQIARLQVDLDAARSELGAAEKRYKLEQDLMLSAWHDLGNKVVHEHLAAVLGGAKRSQSKAVPVGWLGRQRRWKEDAIFSR